MNKLVNFEIAKLLKEKGFDKRTPLVWLFSLGKTHLREIHLSLELNNAEYNAPTIAEVVMWLFEKHGIWIYIPYSYNKEIKFSWVLLNKDTSSNSKTGFNSPLEAYESAIEYCLSIII